ncbi:serine hydrolase domain-containing protein [Flavobacterium degerlachei]|jgi:CubicO group peptidase (beta-lactamase class C family)|uniref:CubicO group peptidase, beta-lactamase class C family n=1 Tax=Flavobacterium degerlachei TaxID=229203 RepID=A0A1H2YKC4_9FLAO|nr:serine hydrolase [Flavobacterium degerlachei]SDX05064.1 CubicO group peptidase, beta-lactamase class C family [Flavobacterium degerlachei]
MYKKYQSVLILFLSFSLSNCTAQKKTSVKTATEVQNDTLDSYFSNLYEAKMFNGAVAVKRKGKLIFKKAYGIANLEKQTPFLTTTSQEIASVSKQFTAAAILLLQQENKLKVTDLATTYLGDDFPYKDITISQLLSHTAGLPDYEPYFRKNWDPTIIAYNKDILQYFKTQKPAILTVAGEKYNYSNTGYILLAEIVNAASGTTLEHYLSKKVFKPMQMNSSFFLGRDSIWEKKNYAPGYMFSLTECKNVIPETLANNAYYRFLSGRLGSGRLSSNIDDLIKWDEFLHDDSIFNKALKELAFTVHPPTKDSSDYGYGWHIINDSVKGKTVYHTGSWAGNLTYIRRSLVTKDLVIILNNTHNSAYLKEIRKAVNGYLNGESLVFPKVKASELFKNSACELTLKMIPQWYQDNKNIDWDVTDLKALQKDYEKIGASDKTEMLNLLISIIQTANKS